MTRMLQDSADDETPHDHPVATGYSTEVPRLNDSVAAPVELPVLYHPDDELLDLVNFVWNEIELEDVVEDDDDGNQAEGN
ncbi:hypothetical protein P3T76_014853 [Phytophthora citrophthora]|uniref:Uncharacterized protein n=1 Tax=Phytophthora citrophthora TaxID=4793 RepID=A0AAD9G0N7_9STRA|nr:hypothetical protein P3T76_014853 [Phytophthora citrophthora]